LRRARQLFVGVIVLLTVLVATSCSASLGGSFEYALPVNPAELSEPELGRVLDLAQEAGVDTVAAGASWWYISPEPSPETYQWEPLDLLVGEAQQRGLKVNLQVTGTPDWVHEDLEESDPDLRVWYPPRGYQQLEHFAGFVQALVERYRSQVERYEIWNEPNYDGFWRPSPDPAEYAALLRAAYMAVKEADPEATVVFGGLSRNDAGYLESYYEAAGEYPEAEENGYFFDVLNVHPYTYGQSPDWAREDAVVEGANGRLDESFAGVETMKAAMEEEGDPDKPIFLGEFGYSVADTWMGAVPDYRRAFYLKRAYAIARELPYVSGMSWYAYVPDGTTGEEWTILDADLEPTLTYRALKQATGAEDAGVEISLREPREPVSGSYVVKPELSGIDEAEASGWELYVDGTLVGSYDEVPLEWDTQQVEDGDHSLLLAMYTKDGSVWPSAPGALTVSNGSETREHP
jgi:hypothetical protein